jgi:hypothetical protein
MITKTKRPRRSSNCSGTVDQIRALKSEVTRLEITLQTLTRASPSSALCEHGIKSSLWEQVARSQKIKKRKALEENERLQMQIWDNIKIFRSIDRILMKSINVVSVFFVFVLFFVLFFCLFVLFTTWY